VGNAGTAGTESGGVPSREALAAVFRFAAAGTAGSGQAQLLDVAVMGGLLITEGVVGCSITEIDGDRCRTSVYAGEAAIALDLVQYAAGRGPCLTAIRHQQLHLTDDLTELNLSLPGWREQADRHGVGSVLSVPLLGSRPAAGLNFYGTAPGMFHSPVVGARALLVGRAVTVLITRHASPAQRANSENAPELLAAVGRRALLAQARTAIAHTGQVSDTEAFAYLAQRSARERRSIVAVARDVLASPDSLAGQELPS
jgi:hypothetical protein